MRPIKPVIKVCGMRDADNIREVDALGIDLMGFIFWPKSSRYVSHGRCVNHGGSVSHGDYPRDSSAAKVMGAVPVIHCKRVGVFVDEDIEQVRRIADDYALDYIQLHGSESPDYIRQLKAATTPHPSRGGMAVDRDGACIIKAFNIATADDLSQTKTYEGLADYFLFDTKGKSVGGNGEKFDWSILSAYDGNTPFLLSGGIGPDDAERVKAFVRGDFFDKRSGKAERQSAAKCIGIDLNSRFEIAPGLKDVAALRRFLTRLTH